MLQTPNSVHWVQSCFSGIFNTSIYLDWTERLILFHKDEKEPNKKRKFKSYNCTKVTKTQRKLSVFIVYRSVYAAGQILIVKMFCVPCSMAWAFCRNVPNVVRCNRTRKYSKVDEYRKIFMLPDIRFEHSRQLCSSSIKSNLLGIYQKLPEIKMNWENVCGNVFVGPFDCKSEIKFFVLPKPIAPRIVLVRLCARQRWINAKFKINRIENNSENIYVYLVWWICTMMMMMEFSCDEWAKHTSAYHSI